MTTWKNSAGLNRLRAKGLKSKKVRGTCVQLWDVCNTDIDSIQLTVSEARVPFLSTRVQGKVQRPAEGELGSAPGHGGDGRVTKSLEELSLNLLGNGRASNIFTLSIERRDTVWVAAASLGDKDLILGKVASVSMVLGVLYYQNKSHIQPMCRLHVFFDQADTHRNAPGVIRNAKTE